ncbi:PREDICTED: protein KHNYN-like [Nanorana parkeri]|uniref:protein KHNYN-like n=1 Tax=Nanorana parkeri TaxID=125878 RepID=UPI000854AAE7|nr:PREDICTED: protein KHNYN-like [Nanorana parkeri]
MLMAVGEYGAAQDDESVDEFAVPQGSEKELRSQHAHMERLFGVTVNIIGVLMQDQLPLQSTGHQQIWVQLTGERRSIVKAKDYIKGLCTPELSEKFKYPREMHCIFVGEGGLFLDCLIRATSACVKPQSHGLITISGMAEGVVMAQSRIQAFLDVGKTMPEDQEASIKRNFKALVEEHNDLHALDLLILPTSTKQQLLTLVEEDKESKPKQPTNHQRECDKAMSRLPLRPATMECSNQRLDKSVISQPVEITKTRHVKGVLRERASEPRELARNNIWDRKKQPELFSVQKSPVTGLDESESSGSYQNETTEMNKRMEPLVKDDEEFQQISGLLDTIMRWDDGEPGSHHNFSLATQKEFNMLLDFFKTMGYQESVVLKVLSENGIQEPSQILDKVKLEQSSHNHSNSDQVQRPSTLKGMAAHAVSGNDDDDYLLEVMKSAAKNCGYSPSEIVDIGDGSVAGLLRKLNEKNNSEDCIFPSVPQRKGQQENYLPRPEINTVNPTMGMVDHLKHKPMGNNHPVEDIFHEEPKDTTVNEECNVPVVTGAQRFNEAMQTPFQLNLKCEKGNDQLRHIVIDGSNVAMIHGLHRFFSCRGIALAVQYFWDKGHRDITVFVPQWRMKKDIKAKEQHFLTELNDLGLLSFTPSRTVEGKRITSYDDRFMLQLAEKTDGVIVTNDQLRDIFAESQAWQTIIKDRVLQFTFVGDIFMVPDDPMGRNGPLLGQFLTRNSLLKIKSKGHSFAGRRSHTSQSPPKPSSQTEVLNLRDRKPGGHKGKEEPESRSHRDTERLRNELLTIFPHQDTKVDFVLHREPSLNDLNKLSELIINLKF